MAAEIAGKRSHTPAAFEIDLSDRARSCPEPSMVQARCGESERANCFPPSDHAQAEKSTAVASNYRKPVNIEEARTHERHTPDSDPLHPASTFKVPAEESSCCSSVGPPAILYRIAIGDKAIYSVVRARCFR
jgi:hypothetical protein